VWLYAAVRDVRTRHVPNYLFGLLAAVGVVRALSGAVQPLALLASVGVVWPLALVLWGHFDVGGADVKAPMVAAVLYPASIPAFLVGTGVGLVVLTERWDDDIPALPAFAVGAIMATLLPL